jgi:hypothetical protein
LGHSSVVYQEYYTPTHIARDYQAIYFGTPSEEQLIQSVASMSISRDQRAPKELDEKQLDEIYNHPNMVALRAERTRCKEELYAQGYRPLCKAKGTALHDQYDKLQKKINSTHQKLRGDRLTAVIRHYPETIDGIEIAKQLEGKSTTEVLKLPVVEYELRERAVAANMLFQPFQDERTRLQFVRVLIKLGRKQETQRPKALKRKIDIVVCPRDQDSSPSKKSQCSVALSLYSGDQGTMVEKKESTLTECEDTWEELYPKVLPHPVCLICIGNSVPTHDWRLRHWPRKDVLKKHVDAHFRDPQFQAAFACRHPKCREVMLDGILHFKRHALDEHGVAH